MPSNAVPLKGKTKRLFPIDVQVESQDTVTWKNKYSENMRGKAKCSTTTIVAMSKLLEANGRATVYRNQVSDTAYRARFGHMIFLEVVVRFRNEELGSLRKREPDLPVGILPEPRVEFYLKSSGKVFSGVALPDDDPLITRWDESGVWVHLPGAKVEGEGTFVPFTAEGWSGTLPELFEKLTTEALTDAKIIRAGWKTIGWDLGDVKLEYCFVILIIDGKVVSHLYLGEAPSNDEWRIRSPDGQERSKENIRSGKKTVPEAANDYLMVAEAAKTIHIGRVAI